MTALFGFFVALVVSEKQKELKRVVSKFYPLLGGALDQWQDSLAIENRWAQTVNSTGNELSNLHSAVTCDFKKTP